MKLRTWLALPLFLVLAAPASGEKLSGCCPLRRTPFFNLVRMRVSSLISKPITVGIGLGTRLVHA